MEETNTKTSTSRHSAFCRRDRHLWRWRPLR